MLATTSRRDQDVRRLDVSMHQAVDVSCIQRLRYLVRDMCRAARHQTPLLRQQRMQIGPDHKPHRDIQNTVGLSNRVNRNHVRMLDLSRDARLPSKPSGKLGVISKAGCDHLQRNDPLRTPLPRPIHDPHTTTPRYPLDNEAIKLCP